MDTKMVRRNKLTKLSPELHKAYNFCYKIARSRYENFAVASKLLPKYLQRSIVAIYAFARIADDIADEGDLARDTRLELMTKFETKLYDLQYGKPPTEPIFLALQHTIECFNLPIQLFYDLLTAFRQDILRNRYQNFTEVLDYCRYSANPVGRLLLHLAGHASNENLLLSDNICTGLQLINFIQDIESDLIQRNRCYIPLDELNTHDVNLNDIAKSTLSVQYTALVEKQINRAMEIYNQGIQLKHNLPGFFGLEIRFIITCGHKILEKLSKRKNVLQQSKLTKFDKLMLLCKLLFKQSYYRYDNEPLLDKL